MQVLDANFCNIGSDKNGAILENKSLTTAIYQPFRASVIFYTILTLHLYCAADDTMFKRAVERAGTECVILHENESTEI